MKKFKDPLNVLWQGEGKSGRVSGVVDWVNACLGPAGADVAHCRTDLAQMFGVSAADGFLQAYLESADLESADENTTRFGMWIRFWTRAGRNPSSTLHGASPGWRPSRLKCCNAGSMTTSKA